MSLSKLAKKILKDPMHWLHIERVKRDGTRLQDAIAHPDHIYDYADFSENACSKKEYTKALREIRKLSQKRGQHPSKLLIHESIKEYAKNICHNFASLNRMNIQIKTVYGSELPVRYRTEFHAYFKDPESHAFGKVSTETPSVVEQNVSLKEVVSLDLEGLSFTLSKGASLTIGKLTTKTLDFKGLKSVSIEKVEDGCLYGVSLET